MSKLEEHKLYHFYNQGNNKASVFYARENYLYFLSKVRKFIRPHCEILAYCLMPNHFHFLIYTTPDSVETVKHGSLNLTKLNNGFRLVLSSYSQAINKQLKRTGSLFRQRTKSKLLNHKDYYPLVCFQYIHQNPLRADIVSKLEDWEFSSFREYASFRNGSLINKKLCVNLLDISLNTFYKDSYYSISDKVLEEIGLEQ